MKPVDEEKVICDTCNGNGHVGQYPCGECCGSGEVKPRSNNNYSQFKF